MYIRYFGVFGEQSGIEIRSSSTSAFPSKLPFHQFNLLAGMYRGSISGFSTAEMWLRPTARIYAREHETTVVPQPPYSLDLAPADFFLFPKLKFSLRFRRFRTVEETEEDSIRNLRAVRQNTFQEAFRNGQNVRRGVSRVERSNLK